MRKLAVKLTNLFRSEKGQGMVEYGLIIGLIAVVLIAALGLVTGGLQNIFEEIATKLGNPPPAT